MRESLNAFIVEADVIIRVALAMIDKNKKGFLVVVNRENVVCGTLTDGDVRRAFIKGYSVDDVVENIYSRTPKLLMETDGLSEAIEIFKNESIKFLPIVDKDRKLQNIITKNQIHSLLLRDIHADLSYDFMSLDENAINYEIYQRPWGFYKTTVMNDYFQSKVISVNPQAQLSLQSHNHREEYWIIAHGRGTVQIDQSVIEVHCGSSIFIPKGSKHRLVNTDEKESLIVTEVQIGDYFGEDDIIRYEDIYGRIKK